MDNLNFNNKPDSSDDIKNLKDLKILDKQLKGLTSGLEPILKNLSLTLKESLLTASYQKQFKQISQIISGQIIDALKNYPYEEISNHIRKAFSSVDFSFIFSPEVKDDDEFEIVFSEEQEEFLKQQECSLDDYSEKTPNKSRKFSKAKLISLISFICTLISTIAAVSSCCHEKIESESTTHEMEHIQAENEKTNELLESILKQISKSTEDETFID